MTRIVKIVGAPLNARVELFPGVFEKSCEALARMTQLVLGEVSYDEKSHFERHYDGYVHTPDEDRPA